MTFTATVAAAAPGAGDPAGTVRFFDGATLLRSATLTDGTATLSTAGLAAGTRTIGARYDGDSSFLIGSDIASHVIADAESTPTVTVSSSRNPANTGQSVTFTANVSMTGVTPTGSVAFYNGAALLGSSALSAGRATFTTTTLPLGSHAITARYLGAGDIPPATSAVFVQTIKLSGTNPKSSTMTLTSSANPSALGAGVDFVINVSGSPRPTGRVLFMIDDVVVGDPAGEPLVAVNSTTARVTLSISTLAHGNHKVTATYLGDANFRGNTRVVTQTVN